MTTLLMKAQKAWQKAKRPKTAEPLAATTYWATSEQEVTDIGLMRGIETMRVVAAQAAPAEIQFISDLERAKRLAVEPIWISGRRPMAVPDSKVAPVKAPAGWPPGEEPATVMTPDGLRAVEQRQYPLGGTPLPENGEFSKAWMSTYYAKCGNKPWQCCTCGTHYPPDPCVPGAYF